MGKMTDPADAHRRWEGRMEEFQQTDSYRKLFGIDGEPIEFGWNIFPGLTSLEILRKTQKDLQEQSIELENIEDRIMFMPMFNDIDWTRRGNSEQCISNSDQVKNYAKKFTQEHWTFLRLGSEKKWYGKPKFLPEGNWQDTANMMVEQFEESGHPVSAGSKPSLFHALRANIKPPLSCHAVTNRSLCCMCARAGACAWPSCAARFLLCGTIGQRVRSSTACHALRCQYLLQRREGEAAPPPLAASSTCRR